MTPNDKNFHLDVVLPSEQIAKSFRTAHDYNSALKIAGKHECVFHYTHFHDGVTELHDLAQALGFRLVPLAEASEAPAEPADLVMSDR